jgi:hypothetical protein
MTRMLEWVRLPNQWIEAKGLRALRWRRGSGSREVAALMVLMVIAHHADQETGIARLTYERLLNSTQLSKTMIAAGLAVLAEHNIVAREPLGRSTYGLINFEPNAHYAKLPARKMYGGTVVTAFRFLNLRKAAELHALKLYFLFASRRGNDTNLANISYDKIEEYTGIDREGIRAGLNILAANGLIHIEQQPSVTSEYGISYGYRLVGIDPYNHAGTKGRGRDIAEILFS